MKTLSSLKLVGVSMILVVGLAACNKPGPAESAGKKMDRAADKAAVVIDDAAITAQVKAAILAEPGLKSLQIGVETVNGVVTLSGAVDSPASSDKAKTLARNVSGVRDVNNLLAVK